MHYSWNVVFFDLGDTLVTGTPPPKIWVQGAKSALEELRARDVRIGIISNTGELDRSELLKMLPSDFHFGLFEDALILLSSEVDMSKPAPGIFIEAVRRAGVAAGTTLFVGESLEETLAAQRVGMKAARVGSFPDDWSTLIEESG